MSETFPFDVEPTDTVSARRNQSEYSSPELHSEDQVTWLPANNSRELLPFLTQNNLVAILHQIDGDRYKSVSHIKSLAARLFYAAEATNRFPANEKIIYRPRSNGNHHISAIRADRLPQLVDILTDRGEIISNFGPVQLEKWRLISDYVTSQEEKLLALPEQ